MALWVKMMNKTKVLFFLAGISFTPAIFAEALLTGEIRAGDVQRILVPWSDSWQKQIKWMKPEGEKVKEGDLVVIFDTSNMNNQIEQEQGKFRQAEEEGRKRIIELEQKKIDADYALIETQLKIKLKKLSADVPKQYGSKLERDNANFDYKKELKNLEKAQVNVNTIKESIHAEYKKQHLEEIRIRSSINKKKHELEQLQVHAKRNGTIIHGLHPWTGEKIAEGQSVQNSWEVATIPGKGNEWVKSWVNEVDWPRVKAGYDVKLTLDAFPESSFKGKITRIGLQAEPKIEWGEGNYYEVKIIIDKTSLNQLGNKLVPGMSVRIEVPVSKQSKGK